MAAPRLPFLYPQLFRSARSYEAGARSLRFQRSGFHATRHRGQDTIAPRQGQSLESKLPPPTQNKKNSVRESSGPLLKKSAKDNTQQGSAQAQDGRNSGSSNQNVKGENNGTPAKDSKTPDKPSHASAQSSENASREVPLPQNPMDAVLQMPPPSEMGLARLPPDGHGIPHLEPTTYIHHFDTYTLVKNLVEGGFSEEQAVTVMKAIRGILQDKLDLAENTLTSKSDSENEEYLFKAACSELRSSLEASRNLEVESQRTSRTHLQHEVDILNLRINQELAKLNDELKGMWNDHKMTTREQQQSQDTGIQELNYKIAVSLASDGKSETEGLRWVLTRRAALAIAFSASKSNLQKAVERKKETVLITSFVYSDGNCLFESLLYSDA
jgi:Protein of unknown function (DUF1640)